MGVGGAWEGAGVRALPPPSNFVCMQFSAKHLPNNGQADPSGLMLPVWEILDPPLNQ